MKFFLSCLCCFILMYGAAQNADDFQDTRKKTESFAKLPKDNIRADLATFTLSGIDEAAGKEALHKIPLTSSGLDFVTFEGDNIKAAVNLASFVPLKHKLDYDEKYLIKIDRKTYYGDYGNIPKTYISKVTLVIGGDTVAIPPAAYADIYNMNFIYTDNGVQRSRDAIYTSKDGHRLYLYLFCKNNTGSYEVTWIIQDKAYIRRVLDYGFM